MGDVPRLSLRNIDHVRDLLDRLRLDHDARSRGAVIVEGVSDATMLAFSLDEDLSFFPLAGRVNVLRAADNLATSYLSGVVCVADTDFDQIAVQRTHQWFLVFSDDADVEAMLYWSPALERVLEQWASKKKYAEFGGCSAVRAAVELAVQPIAVLRAWNATSEAGLKFDSLDVSELVEKMDLSTNLVSLVGRLGKSPKTAAEVQEALDLEPPVCPHTGRLLARGRDRLAVVGVALRHAIGTLSKQQIAGGLVEKSLRLATKQSDLSGTPFKTRFEAALVQALAQPA
jgi:hypothetical protein